MDLTDPPFRQPVGGGERTLGRCWLPFSRKWQISRRCAKNSSCPQHPRLAGATFRRNCWVSHSSTRSMKVIWLGNLKGHLNLLYSISKKSELRKKKKKKRITKSSHGNGLPSSMPNQTFASHLLQDKAVRTDVCIVANCFRVILQHTVGMWFERWSWFGEFGPACKERAKMKAGVITFTWQPVEGFAWVNGFLIDSFRPWQRQ